jgi:outer membrane protein assembly factor BamB
MSPIIVDGRCIVDVGGKDKGTLIAFDLVSGEPKWKLDGDAPSSASPVLMTVEGRKQLVFLTAKNLTGVSLSNGRELWHVPFAAQQGNNASPVIDGQTVIYTGQSKGISAVKIEQQAGSFTATPAWSNPHYGPRFTTPILHDGLLFGFNGHYYCVNARTGEDRWIEDANHGNSAALVDAGTVIFGLSVNSELVAFKPDEKQYAELAKYKVADTETWAHPIVAGKRVFIRDRDSVALWTFE